MNLVAIEAIPNSVGMIEPGQAFAAVEPYASELLKIGKARVDDGRRARWAGLDWPDSTVVVLASGPSLTLEQCEAVLAWREHTGAARRAIAINNTFQRAPWADVLYACDEPWWKIHHAEVSRLFHGELWTQDALATKAYGIKRVESVRGAGLGKRPGVIHQGGNGGYQAINLAYQAGAQRIILLGFDMKGSHWHGRHISLPNTADWLFERWKENFVGLAKDLKAEGVEVINCSPGTALQCFEKRELASALDEETTREGNLSDSQGSLVSARGV